VHKAENASTQMASLHLPAPTVWPMVLGLGITLIAAGLITAATITVLGLLLSVLAAIGWFRNVLPHEQHEMVEVPVAEAQEAAPALPRVEQVAAIERPTYSFIAGVEAGLGGGVAMAAVTALFGWLKVGSLWYGVNLLAAGSFIGWTGASDSFLGEFHLEGLLVAAAIHGMVSVLVGLIYGTILPIFPRWSMITAGVIAPLIWSGLAYSMMQAVSPIVCERMDWRWFVLSQIAYGLMAGLVIHLRIKVHQAEFQSLPLSQRAGLHTNESHQPDTESGGGQ